MVEQNGKQLVKGALLLTLAGIISKVLSAGYRVPLQNLTGDVGFYIYQQVYPILGVAMMLGLYGFPQAISKMIVDFKRESKGLTLKGFYIPILIILFLVNGISFLTLWHGADFLSKWIGDPNLVEIYQFAACIFLLVPFTSLLRGVFKGKLYMKPTAYSQLVEQFVRVSMIIVAAIVVINHHNDLYDIGKAAVLASLLGAGAAIFVLLIYFIKKRPLEKKAYSIPWGYYIKTIVVLGVIAALNHIILLGIQLADTFTLVPNLEAYGATKLDAMELKGVFDRGQPLIQLGTVLGSSFALALIPSISKDKLVNERDELYFYIRTALIFSFYMAVAATIGLIVIFQNVNILLFLDDKGTFDLQILVLSVFLSSLAITAASVLQGLGYIKRTAFFILLIFLIKGLLNGLLVPMLGITGSAIATVLSLFSLLVMVLIDLKRKLPKLNFFKSIRLDTLARCSSAMIVYLVLMELIIPDALLTSRLYLLIYILFIVFTGACIFIIGLLRGNAFTERQLALLPFASFFIRISRGGYK